MEAEEEVFEEKFFICLRAKQANKNKINFDEKTDDDAEMKTSTLSSCEHVLSFISHFFYIPFSFLGSLILHSFFNSFT